MRQAEALATEAKVFFKAGLFEKASMKFMEAYALSKRPSLLYNAARAYEEGRHNREAVALFKAYRVLPDVTDHGRADADARIARMEGELAVEAKAAALKAEQAAALKAEQAAADKTAADKAADCNDNDPCTLDACGKAGCSNLACNDGKFCTADVCTKEGCSYPPTNEGKACRTTIGMKCKVGVCTFGL